MYSKMNVHRKFWDLERLALAITEGTYRENGGTQLSDLGRFPITRGSMS
jgi:hypothetical protein